MNTIENKFYIAQIFNTKEEAVKHAVLASKKRTSQYYHISTQGLFNILSGLDHVVMSTVESREDAEGVIQCNLDEGLLDEVELLIELSGE